jgi:hypothetical protein
MIVTHREDAGPRGSWIPAFKHVKKYEDLHSGVIASGAKQSSLPHGPWIASPSARNDARYSQ